MQGSGSVFDRDDGVPNEPVCCDCFVEIIDYKPVDANERYFGLDTKFKECYQDCPQFGGLFYDPYCGPTAACIHALNYPNPAGLYSFNCCVEDTDTLTFAYKSFYYDNVGCSALGTAIGDTLTYRIICSNTDPATISSGCEGISFQSQPITVVTNITGNNVRISFTKYLECDCFPVVE